MVIVTKLPGVDKLMQKTVNILCEVHCITFLVIVSLVSEM